MQIIKGDSINVLKTIEDNSIEALVTDPPYGLSKMTQKNIENCFSSWLAGDKYEPMMFDVKDEIWRKEVDWMSGDIVNED